MSIIKSFSVGNGDTFYIKHGNDSFTVIDCCLDESNINDIIDECSKDLDITVTDDQKAQIAELMQKINKLDLNVNDLKEQASKIYDKLSDMDIDTQGIFEKIKAALSSIFAALSGLFN